MARVTVQDCLKKVDNRFNLILKASSRARDLELGAADPTVPLDNDKPTVIALREIALGNDISRPSRVEVTEMRAEDAFKDASPEGEKAEEAEEGAEAEAGTVSEVITLEAAREETEQVELPENEEGQVSIKSDAEMEGDVSEGGDDEE